MILYPGVAILIAARSHTFMDIDHEIISMVIIVAIPGYTDLFFMYVCSTVSFVVYLLNMNIMYALANMVHLQTFTYYLCSALN